MACHAGRPSSVVRRGVHARPRSKSIASLPMGSSTPARAPSSLSRAARHGRVNRRRPFPESSGFGIGRRVAAEFLVFPPGCASAGPSDLCGAALRSAAKERPTSRRRTGGREGLRGPAPHFRFLVRVVGRRRRWTWFAPPLVGARHFGHGFNGKCRHLTHLGVPSCAAPEKRSAKMKDRHRFPGSTIPETRRKNQPGSVSETTREAHSRLSGNETFPRPWFEVGSFRSSCFLVRGGSGSKQSG